VSEVSKRYSTVAAGFSDRVEGTPSDRWSAPSPCTEWTARDVLVHVINTHRRVLSTVDESQPQEVNAADDLALLWAEVSADMTAAVEDPERSQKTVAGMFGEQPFESLVGRLLCADTLIHTWDLARATGQDDQLDSEAVAKAMEFLTPIDDAIRRPGGFAAKIAPPPDADAQTCLMAFCGRQA
jgi:uncharacterized protein (TIGR03086 family)